MNLKEQAEKYVGFNESEWTGEIGHTAKSFLAGARAGIEAAAVAAANAGGLIHSPTAYSIAAQIRALLDREVE